MREYKKPEIQIVNLKSSEDIALTFDNLQKDMVGSYLSKGRTYVITGYAVSQSAYNAKIENPTNG